MEFQKQFDIECDEMRCAVISCARGAWQREIANDLAWRRTIDNPLRDLRGRAKDYYSSYARSFYSLRARIEKALEATRFELCREPGLHGGEWSASYYIAERVAAPAPAASASDAVIPAVEEVTYV